MRSLDQGLACGRAAADHPGQASFPESLTSTAGKPELFLPGEAVSREECGGGTQSGSQRSLANHLTGDTRMFFAIKLWSSD